MWTQNPVRPQLGVRGTVCCSQKLHGEGHLGRTTRRVTELFSKLQGDWVELRVRGVSPRHNETRLMGQKDSKLKGRHFFSLLWIECPVTLENLGYYILCVTNLVTSGGGHRWDGSGDSRRPSIDPRSFSRNHARNSPP